MPGQRRTDVVQLLDLLLGERVEDDLPDRLDVAGRGVPELLPAFLGDDRDLTAAVGLDPLPADPADLFEPVHRMRETAARTERGHRQLTHPQPSVLGVGQPDQDLEVGVRHPGVTLQLLLDARVDYALSRDERPPGPLLLEFEPPWFRHLRSVAIGGAPRCDRSPLVLLLVSPLVLLLVKRISSTAIAQTAMPTRAKAPIVSSNKRKAKDKLIAAYLERRDRTWHVFMDEQLERRKPGTPEEVILAVFAALTDWLAESRRGCGFINASVELAAPDHPAMPVILAQKQWMRAEFAAQAKHAGFRRVDELADRLLLLHEGALVCYRVAAMQHSPEVAHRAAQDLLASWPRR